MRISRASKIGSSAWSRSILISSTDSKRPARSCACARARILAANASCSGVAAKMFWGQERRAPKTANVATAVLIRCFMMPLYLVSVRRMRRTEKDSRAKTLFWK